MKLEGKAFKFQDAPAPVASKRAQPGGDHPGEPDVSLRGHRRPERAVRRHPLLRAHHVERRQEGSLPVQEGEDLQASVQGGPGQKPA